MAIAYKNDSLEEKYGKTIEDLLGRYTTNEESDDRIGSQKVLAGLIYQLMHYAEVYNPEIQAKIAGQFAEKFPNTKLPALDEAPLTSKWGPFPREAWGESYNRALNAFRMIAKNLTRWEERHGKANGYRSQALDPTSKPRFMMDPSLTLSEVASLLHASVRTLDSKVSKIYWADARRLREDLEDDFETIPDTTKTAPDPRAMDGDEWRNEIRDLYEFGRLKSQFSTLFVLYSKNDCEEDVNLLECVP